MPQITANGIKIEYQTHGDPANPPILLVMGLGMQLIGWPPEFVEALVSRGFYVIRHDNRDVGLSEKFDHAGIPNFRLAVVMKLLGLNPRAPYRLSDMAGDAAGLLRALKIDRAHVVGASLGGMIAQVMAIEYPDQVASLTSVMSTTGHRGLPSARREATAAMLDRPSPNATLEQNIARGIRVARAIGSPAWPAPEERLRKRFTESYQRSFYPEGVVRQFLAIIADGDRRARLRRVKAPTLVIHGTDDPLIPIEGGRDTAAHIPGARLHEIAGMGHDLPLELVDELADQIAGHARRS